MLRASFLRRLYLGYVALIVFTIVVTGVLMGRRIEQTSLEEIQRSLETAAVVLREWSRPALVAVGEGDTTVATALAASIQNLTVAHATRLTVILPDGGILADSHELPRVMENHAQRPEVIQARTAGRGQSTRLSPTLGVRMMYVAVAVRAKDGGELLGFCRTALPIDTVDQRLRGLRDSIVLSAIASSVLALIFGYLLARRFTRPLREVITSIQAISRGDLDRSIDVHPGDEFGTLARAFNAMRARIGEHHDTIVADRNKILAILSAMTEGVIAVDKNEEIVHLNAAAGGMFKLDPGAAIGHSLRDVLSIGVLHEAVETTLAGADGEQGTISLQSGMSTALIELQSTGLRDGEGDVVGAVIVLRDVTDIRHLEGVRSDFISNVSHELKTPLAAIKGLVESILEDDAMPEDIRQRFLARIGRQSDRLNSLVVDLLSISRLERESDALFEDVSLDLRMAVGESIDSLRTATEQKGLDLVVEISNEPVYIVADTETVRQIVDNLISNAIRYTPAEGRVTVRLAARDGQAQIEVEDTGVGIDPIHHERIFERFYRVDKARSREVGGTGLGLAIVKHVVRRLGGSIDLDSEVGRGSRFTIGLPLAPDDE